MISFQKTVLRNGLRVIVHTDKTTPFVAINVCYNVGAKHEDPDRTGFAHLFEHLTFGGTKNIPDFDLQVQLAGGNNNAYTTNDLTNYYITVPSANIETALWIESDRMLGPHFTKKGLDVQRRVVIEEFQQRSLNVPYGDIWHLLRDLAYKVHPYRWPTIGLTPQHIEKATLEEVKTFFYNHYAPNNAILVVSGNIESDKAFRLVEKWFESIPKRQLKNPTIEPEPKQLYNRELTVKRDVPVDTFHIAWHMCSRTDPDFYVADLLSDILSGGNSSRIEEKLIRETRLLSEGDVFLSGENDAGLFVATGKPSETSTLEMAKAAMLEEVMMTAEELIKPEELEKVINKVEADLLYNEIGYLEKATQLAAYELMGGADLINQQSDFYRAVTPDKIRSFAQKIFHEGNKNTLNYLSIKKLS